MYPLNPMRPYARLRRGFAGLLASVALLSAAARPLLACEMLSASDSTGPAETAAAAADPHAHHRMATWSDAATQSAEDDASPASPSNRGAPSACDHLINCTVMVVAASPSEAAAPTALPDAAPQWEATRHDAPKRAIEPPPPRA
jgi:hypothetical protein